MSIERSEPELDNYLDAVKKLGWSESLVNEVIEMAGGYDELISDAKAAGELVFINSISNRPDLENEEPTTTTGSAVLAHVEFLSEDNTKVLSSTFDKHDEAIRVALASHLSSINGDIQEEFIHLTHEMEDFEVANLFDGAEITDECKRYAFITVYYLLVHTAASLMDMLSAKNLKNINLITVNQISCVDTKIVIDAKATKKINGFLDDERELNEIVSKNYINLLFFDTAKGESIQVIEVIAKKPSYQATPIKLSCSDVDLLTARGASLVMADIVNKKSDVIIICEDNSVCDIQMDIKTKLEVHVEDDSTLVLSGNAESLTESRVTGNATLLAARFDSKHQPIDCTDEAFVFVDSEKFYNSSGCDEVNASVINMVTIPDDPGFIQYAENLRLAGELGADEELTNYSSHTRHTKPKKQTK